MKKIIKYLPGLVGVIGLLCTLFFLTKSGEPSVEQAQTADPRPSADFLSSPSSSFPSLSSHRSSEPSLNRKFAEMRVLERNAIMEEVAKQDLASIFHAMLDAERVEHDPMKQMHLQSVLSGALQTRPLNPEFRAEMRVFVLDSSKSNFERQLVLGALRSAGTKGALDLMLEVAADSPEADIKQSAAAIGTMIQPPTRGGESPSPSLERVWRESTEQNLLLNVAVSMAKSGEPSSIEMLLNAALGKDSRDNRVAAAEGALKEVYLPRAVPPLAARLEAESADSETARLVAPILVHIGDPIAAKTVVSWIQNRDENAGALVRELVVQQTRSEPMLHAWAAALDPSFAFRNEENREAIRGGLATYQAGHPIQR